MNTPSTRTTSIFTSAAYTFTYTTAIIQIVNSVKLTMFKGVGNEYLDQFWFVAKAVWEA